MSGSSSGKFSAHYCAVKTCLNNSFSCKLTFFAFPKDLERCKEWVRLSDRDDLTKQTADYLNKNYSICAEHFEYSQFLNAKVRSKLVHNAIPSLVAKRLVVPTPRVALDVNPDVNSDAKLNPVVVLEDCVKKRPYPYAKPCPKSKRKKYKPAEEIETSFQDTTVLLSPKKMDGESCAAVFCANTKTKYKNLCFFSFPRDFERCMVWVRNAGRDDLLSKSSDELHKNAVLCAAHFDSGQFLNPPDKKRLCWDAIPTVFKSTNHNYQHHQSPKAQTSTPVKPPIATKSPTTAPEPKKKQKQAPTSTPAPAPTPTPTTPTTTTTNNSESILQSISKYLPTSTVSLLKIHFLRVRKNVTWTRSGRRLATILYVHFYDRYQALALQFGLPQPRLLRKWLRKDQFYPGVHTDHLRMLHDSDVFSRCGERVEKKSAVLVMRRLKLSPALSYDAGSDRVEGLHDLDRMGRARYVATHAIVLTVKGMLTEWRLPVGYFPVCEGQMTVSLVAKLLFEALAELESTGLQVRVLVVAYTRHTQQLMEYFTVSLSQPYIYFMGHRILVVYDPPSLLKRLFYSFKKSDIRFGERNVASWRQVEKFYAVDTAQKYPVVPEITMTHMEAGSYGQVTTKMATQVFHFRTAASIFNGNYLGDKHEDAASTAIFLHTIAELYGYFSGKLPADVSPKQLTQLLAKMKNLYYTKGKEPKACLRAWHLSISSLGHLWHDLSAMNTNMNTKILRLKDAHMTRLRNKTHNQNDTSSSVRHTLRQLSVAALMRPNKLKCLKLEPLFFPKVVQRLSAQIQVAEKEKPKKKLAEWNKKAPREFPRENGLSMLAGLIVKNVFERHSCAVCGRHWARTCSLSSGATRLYVLWLEGTNGITNGVANGGREIAVPTERLMQLVARLEDFFAGWLPKVVHMDRLAGRLGKALRRRFRTDLAEMCSPAKKAFLTMFVRSEIARCLSAHNTRKARNGKGKADAMLQPMRAKTRRLGRCDFAFGL